MSISLSIEQLSYRYPQAETMSLTDSNVSVNQGEFVLLLGASGSGKSTFLRAINGLVPRFYGGSIAGQIKLNGQPLEALSQRDLVRRTGFLQQDPERQLILQTVERELVFGLENLAFPQAEMNSRLAEMSQLFGLNEQIGKKTAELSGGEKQRIALASTLAPYPGLLLLDEPTSQLDPVHAEDVLQTVRRLNEEWGLTVLISEHRIERCFHLADRILLFEAGRIAFNGTPDEFVKATLAHAKWQLFLPPVTRHLIEFGMEGNLPLTVKAARAFVANATDHFGHHVVSSNPQQTDEKQRVLYKVQRIKAGYPDQESVLSDLSLTIHSGDRIALLGENGAGKSTLAKLMCGAIEKRAGEMSWEQRPIGQGFWEDSWKRIGYLSQNPNDYFLHDTVEGEIDFTLAQLSLTSEERERQKTELLNRLGLFDYRNRHPHDLSGGEKQRLALALVVPARPTFLILDEPTRGLDAEQKRTLIELLTELEIPAVMIITHDVEFAAQFANRVLVLHRGKLVADDAPEHVFRRSFAYMPQVYKLYRSANGDT
ncbi:ABC transporter ATP-binding protein [Brevibacillus fluminis]|uniref:ABC transporter ATP-binding protein n=1 Tax=Brevibacillus fluminis TaxID=511487 RepID=A0A3M8CU18_9BACL|nr:energy-coupling factor transporter ATPase [Brevibacillus fluminis]RNB78757.1 ABC transporter ATP-binding protein [Brevibacillus fluminis]